MWLSSNKGDYWNKSSSKKKTFKTFNESQEEDC